MTLHTELHDALTQRLGWLRGLARHLVRDHAVAEDLVQDTMVAALTRRPELDRPLEPWLSDVLHRLHRQHRRGSARRSRRERAAASEEALGDSTDLVARLELVQKLVRAVQDLPEPFRTAVALRYESGLQPAEIARKLGVKGSTVRWRIHEGLNRLRARLDQQSGSRQAWVAALLPLASVRVEPVTLAPRASAWWSTKSVAAVVLGVTLVTAVALAWTADTADPSREMAAGATQPALQPLPPPLAGGSASPQRRPVESSVDDRPTSAARARLATLQGRVVDEGGAAVAGSRVCTIYAAPYALAETSPSLGDRKILNETAAQQDGSFALDSAPGLLQLVAFDAQGVPTMSRPLRLRADEVRTGIILTTVASRAELPAVETPSIEPAPTVHMRLSAAWRDGRPAAGLRVVARVRNGPDRVARTAGFEVTWRAATAKPVAVDDDGEALVPVPAGVATTQLGFEFLDATGSLGITPSPASPNQVVVVAPRASLTGTVLRDPVETSQPEAIGLSCGDGYVYTCRITDGSFAFPALPAGGYELRWLDSYRPSGSGSTIVFVTERLDTPPQDVVLQPGESAQLLLDRQSLPLLRGAVRIDGEVPRHWQIDIVPQASNGAPELAQRALPLGSGGEFHVRLPRPGPYELRLSTTDGARVAPMYARQLLATANGSEFELAMHTCAVSGHLQGDPPKGQLWLRTSLPDGGMWLAPLDVSPGGALFAPRAAHGEADVVLAEHDGTTARTAPRIARLQIPDGGLSGIVVTLPEK